MDAKVTPDGLGDSNANQPSHVEAFPVFCERGLVLRAQQGEKRAFLGLFEAGKNCLYSLSLRITDTEEEAENLTSEIFIQVSRRIHEIRDDREFTSQIYRTAVDRATKKTLTRGTTAAHCPSTTREPAVEQGLSL